MWIQFHFIVNIHLITILFNSLIFKYTHKIHIYHNKQNQQFPFCRWKCRPQDFYLVQCSFWDTCCLCKHNVLCSSQDHGVPHQSFIIYVIILPKRLDSFLPTYYDLSPCLFLYFPTHILRKFLIPHFSFLSPSNLRKKNFPLMDLSYLSIMNICITQL